MTGDQVDTILKRATTDGAFLDRLLSKPRETAQELGVSLSDEEAATVSAMSKDEFHAFAAEYRSAVDSGKRRAAC